MKIVKSFKEIKSNQPLLALHPAQENIFFESVLDPSGAKNNLGWFQIVDVDIEIDQAKCAWRKMYESLDAMRLVFTQDEDGVPRQFCRPASGAYPDLIELDYCSVANAHEAAIGWMQSQLEAPLFMGEENLWKAVLIKISSSKSIIFFSCHHIVNDGFGFCQLFDIFHKVYHDIDSVNSTDLLTDFPQYLDEVAMAQAYLDSNQYKEDESYWSKFNFSDLVKLPQRYRVEGSEVQSVQIPEKLKVDLKQFSQDNNVGLLAIVMSAVGLCISAYCQQSNFSMATVLHGRLGARAKKSVGMFSNMVPIEFNTDESMSLLEYINGVASNVKLGVKHGFFPASHSSRFVADKQAVHSAVWVLYDRFMAGQSLHDCCQPLQQVHNAKEQDPLLIRLQEYQGDGCLRLRCSYLQSYFSAEEIALLLGRIVNIFEILVAKPDITVKNIDLISEHERDLLMNKFNSNQPVEYSNVYIHQGFELHARQQPDRVALSYCGETLSYRQLNNQANKVAHYLASQGVRPGVLVGLCMQQSLDMVVVMLAILKAGGAYLPLDPTYPDARLSYIVNDSALATIVSDKSSILQLGLLDIKDTCDFINIDDSRCKKLLAFQSIDDIASLDIGLCDDDLAYVIYTSGSTGQPKGVAVQHKAIASHMHVMNRALNLQLSDRVLQFSNIGFDAAVEQIFGALIVGATLYLRQDNFLDVDIFKEFLLSNRISCIDLPTGFAKEFVGSAVEDSHFMANTALSRMIVGGEVLPVDLAEKWLASDALQQCQLLNAYGPTEACITTSLYTLCADSTLMSVPVGKPLDNTRAYVVDKNHHLVGIGVPGELLIGGAGLAQGYLLRDKLTSENFISDPFSKNYQARVYKSGDLVRWLPDGNLEFIGRLDSQVKIRGYRIELGEIEYQISLQASVKSAVVTTATYNGIQQLIGYVVPRNHASLNSDRESVELIKNILISLQAVLPDYMVPASLMLIESLPMTANGKLDYRALPEPKYKVEESYVAAETKNEKLLLSIWSNLLGVDEKVIGVHSSFFELGGHSLLVIRLITAVRSHWRVELAIGALFTCKTIRQQAALIENATASDLPVIGRVANRNGFPLSYSQQQLWLIDQIEVGSPHYNMPQAIHLRGPLNVVALTQALRALLDRHEILRTVYRSDNDTVLQYVQAVISYELIVEDITDYAPADRQRHLHEIQRLEALLPFDLSADLMLRTRLLKIDSEEHVLLLTMHHIAADGWSLAVFNRELGELYNGKVSADTSSLMPLLIQYGDFAQWQRDWLVDDVLASDLDYWKGQLLDVPILHNLPLDYQRPVQQAYLGDAVVQRIDAELAQQLRLMAQQSGCTLFMLLHCVFTILLSRYSGQTDIVVGTPVANREQAELDSLIGFFVNTLVLRSDLSGALTFSDVLAQSKKLALQGFEHQKFPFEQLVEELSVERSLSHTPLFQVMLVLQNNTVEELSLHGLRAESLSQSQSQSQSQRLTKFDLTLQVEEGRDGLILDWEFATGLFERATVERMSAGFELLLKGMLENPDTLIATVPLLTASDRQRQLQEYNFSGKHREELKCIHELFEAQVESNPNSVAAVYETETLTFQELNQQANRLAHYLVAKGVQADSIVGVCINRSLDMIVAVLAILKAGGAYLPLDPKNPRLRLQHMLNDSSVAMVLSKKSLLATFDAVHTDLDCELICLDDSVVQGQIAGYNHNNIASNAVSINCENLAYIIYTSGSTGNPKGVLQRHQTVSNLVVAQQRSGALSESMPSLQLASIAFDVSIQEIATAWATGSCLVLLDEERRLELRYIIAVINTHAIGRLFISPAMLHCLADEIIQNNISVQCIKEIIVAGEAINLSEAMVALWQQLEFTFINHYGPTETHVVTAFTIIDKVVGSAPLIGSPVDNNRLYVLDREKQLLPSGVVGELYAAGVGVARGYLNRDDLTREKFIESTILGCDDEVLYRTGDLVRWNNDGNLEFVGRADDQVKIRGYRVELGEIESSLIKYTLVNDAIVLVDECNIHKPLICYLIPTDVSSIDDSDAVMDLKVKLHEHLKSNLPDYMIPSSFTLLKKFPLTINGKIDKNALPAPERTINNDYVAPDTLLEKRVCDIWMKVLEISELGVESDLFKVGGNSLVAIKLVSLLNVEFHSQISVKDIFHCKTVRAISKYIVQTQGSFKYVNYQILRDQPGDDYEPFPLTNIQKAYLYGRLDSFEMGNVSTHCYDEVHYKALDVVKFEKAINRVVAEQAALRTVFETDCQRVLRQAPYYTVKNHGKLTTPEYMSVRENLSHKEYSVDRFPLFDFEVSQYNGESILHVSIDALIMDATSLSMLFKDIALLYNADNMDDVGRSSIEISFRDYMQQYDRIRASSLFEDAGIYWQKKLSDYNFDAQLPIRVDPAEISDPQFCRLSKTIPNDTWKIIEGKADALQLSPTSVMLYVYGLVLSKWSGQASFCINLTLFNRLPLHSKVNELWGDFTVLELFDFKRRGDESIAHALTNVQKMLWDDIENNLFDGIDFQRMARRELQLPQNKALSPIVLTSLLGLEVDQSSVIDGYIRHGYSITQTSQVYLDNKVYQTDDGVVVEWDYVEQLFDASQIENMHENYCSLISCLADTDWNSTLPSLPVPVSHAHIINQANASIRPKVESTLPALCENGARINPDAIAVIDVHGQFSYATVMQSSYRLAHCIYQGQSLSGQLIAVLCEKGMPQLVSSLGIMLSGAGYLPLNIDWPLGRIDEVLQEGGVSQVVVTLAQYQQLIQSSNIAKKYQWLIVGEIIADARLPAGKTGLPLINLGDVAYVIFTSGSTGKPKGVTISHSGAVNTILAVNTELSVCASDSVLALSELSFDLSVYDLFGVMAAGGTIVFPEQSRSKEPGHWHDLIRIHNISLWNTVPQLMQLLVDYVCDFDLPLTNLRWVMMSGDWIPVALPRQIKTLQQDIRIMSLGGATEGSIWSIWYEVDNVSEGWSAIPYGHAMPSQKMYVLNEQGEHCPIAVAGEIHIGGAGVALGYWQDSDKTMASFIHHSEFGRLYKTGDIGCWHRDGYITFLGRKDNQVKINGYRVELEEIATKLTSVLGIDKAVTTVQSNQVVAYLVSEVLTNRSNGLAGTDFNASQFKLQQNGIRTALSTDQIALDLKLDEHEYRLRKSYRQYVASDMSLNKSQLLSFIERATTNVECQIAAKPLTLAAITAVLKSVSAITLEDRVLPKYLYPSAGSSYAIQTTLVVHERVEQLSAGCYYYQPVSHLLAPIDNPLDISTNNQLLTLQFSLYKPAIEPLYGKEFQRFAYLELGHILAELEASLLSLGWSYNVEMNDQECGDYLYLAEVSLSGDSEVVSTSAKPWQSNVVEFDYLLNKDNIYSDDKICIDLNKQDISKSITDFGQLLLASSAMICFKGGDTPVELVASGYQAQKLSQILYRHDIGSCTLGFLPYDGINYCLSLGSIDNCLKGKSDSRIVDKSIEGYLTEKLQGSLPSYMLPKHYLLLDALPLTANGKVDTKRLPAVNIQEDNYVAARNELEQLLVDIWQQVLKIDRVGINDNFFSIGIDSIVAIRIITRCKNVGICFSVADIFTRQTIAKLAPVVVRESTVDHYVPFSLLQTDIRENYSSYRGLGIVDAYPASQLQIGMLIESSRNNKNYHEIIQYKINKRFNKPLLVSVLTSLINKHENMRTAFVDDKNYGYMSVVTDAVSPNIEIVTEIMDSTDLRDHILLNAFDYKVPGIFRCTVSSIDTKSFVFSFSFHHAIMDGWSISGFVDELLRLYLLEREYSVEVDELPRYGQFIAAEMSASEDHQYSDFWREYLRGYETPSIAIVDNVKDVSLTHRDTNLILSEQHSSEIIKISSRLGIPVDSIFVAVYHSVLCSLQNTLELVVGLVVNNRLECNGGDKQLGLFLNTIPMRMTKPADNKTVGAWLTNIAEEKNKILSFKSLPYSKISKLWGDEKLISCIFNYSHFHKSVKYSDADLLAGEIGNTDMPIALNVVREGDIFSLSLVFDPTLVALEQQSQLMTYMEHSLKIIAECDESIVHASFGLNAPDRIVIERGNRKGQVSTKKNIVSSFQSVVAAAPESIALTYLGENISYEQLDEISSNLALRIRAKYASQHGVSIPADTLLAVYVDRSINMIVSILAILKSGAAYVPIDSAYPPARAQYILQDSSAAMVVSEAKHLDRIQSFFEDSEFVPPLILVDDDIDLAYCDEYPLVSISSENLAYVIYTSGTSGKPKGVMINHSNVVSLVTAQIAAFKTDVCHRSLQFASYVFDASVFEIFGSLLSGHQLFICSETERNDFDRLGELIARNKIEFATLPPVVLANMDVKYFSSLKSLLTAGETPALDVLERLSQTCNVYNAYGPTEATVCATANLYRHGDSASNIGHAINSSHLYVLSPDRQAVPIGAPGELYIGGAGLARGYLNRPELSAECFVDNPYATTEDRNNGFNRLYKTGDLVRMNGLGKLIFLGRNDYQVKIRGYRIELGEISAVIRKIDGVNQVVVIDVLHNERKQIHAYIVPDSDASLDIAIIRRDLEGRLPDYMIPASILFISHIPMTINGKIDRHELSNLESLSVDNYQAPNSDTEIQLCNIWKNELGLDRVGIDDNFFHVGGDSISALMITQKMKAIFDVEIGIDALFELKTIKNISQAYSSCAGLDSVDEEIIII